jgi:hypothetical protein
LQEKLSFMEKMRHRLFAKLMKVNSTKPLNLRQMK